RLLCEQAGVADPVALAEFTLDLAISQDLSFMSSALLVQDVRGASSPAVGGAGFRISYRVAEGGGKAHDVVLSVAPPRELMIRQGVRFILDTEKNTWRSGTAETMRCAAADGQSGVAKLGAYGLREDAATVQGWLRAPSTPDERVELSTILGRKAVCKISGVPGALSSAICHDHDLGVLLRVDVRAAQQVIFELEATAFGPPVEADFAIPADVQHITKP